MAQAQDIQKRLDNEKKEKAIVEGQITAALAAKKKAE